MLSPDIMTYIMAALVAALGALGLYTRGQHYRIESLDAGKKAAEGEVLAATRVAQINNAKAKLHKDVARTVVKNGAIARERVKRIQEKIDAIENGEDFIITI